MRLFVFLAGLCLTSAAYAQDHVHDPAPAPASGPAAGADHSEHRMPAAASPEPSGKGRVLFYKNPMGGADTSPVPKKDSMGMDYIPVYESERPATITDHAADRVFDPKTMAAARALLKSEHGGEPVSLFMVNILELQSHKGGDGYRWEGEAWYGGDSHRAVLKLKGEGDLKGSVESAEIQALYARPIGPYFNLQAGIRYDAKPAPSRGYATVGFEGLAPYWFEVGGALFVSNKGDAHARLEGYYDLSITQRLVLQPRAEIDVAAQDVPELTTGAGVSTVEAELRLRYEIRREFAPYIGISFERKVGQTAAMARASGERAQSTRVVAGVRLFF